MERKESVLMKLIQDIRKKGGMKLSESGVPDRVYTNQSETCNSMLAAKKQSLGFAKKDDISKSNFVRNVWQAVVNEQDTEIQKAIYGQSEQFRLKEEAKYLQVSIEEWYSWSKHKKERYGVLQLIIFPLLCHRY